MQAKSSSICFLLQGENLKRSAMQNLPKLSSFIAACGNAGKLTDVGLEAQRSSVVRYKFGDDSEPSE
jgi:hypothetical protein